MWYIEKRKRLSNAAMPIRPVLISSDRTMRRLRVCIYLLPPVWKLLLLTSIKFVGTYLYTWFEKGTLRVKRLAQEHNTLFN